MGEGLGTIIPFNVVRNGIVLNTDATGQPEVIGFTGFSSSYSIYSNGLQPGEWATGTITNVNYWNNDTAFIAPRDVVVDTIYIRFSTAVATTYDPGITVRPFVCLAVSDMSNLSFTILQQTMVFSEPYVGGATIPANTVRTGSKKGIGAFLPEGTLIAIVMGFMADGSVTSALSLRSSLCGGMLLK